MFVALTYLECRSELAIKPKNFWASMPSSELFQRGVLWDRNLNLSLKRVHTHPLRTRGGAYGGLGWTVQDSALEKPCAAHREVLLPEWRSRVAFRTRSGSHHLNSLFSTGTPSTCFPAWIWTGRCSPGFVTLCGFPFILWDVWRKVLFRNTRFYSFAPRDSQADRPGLSSSRCHLWTFQEFLSSGFLP